MPMPSDIDRGQCIVNDSLLHVQRTPRRPGQPLARTPRRGVARIVVEVSSDEEDVCASPAWPLGPKSSVNVARSPNKPIRLASPTKFTEVIVITDSDEEPNENIENNSNPFLTPNARLNDPESRGVGGTTHATPSLSTRKLNLAHCSSPVDGQQKLETPRKEPVVIDLTLSSSEDESKPSGSGTIELENPRPAVRVAPRKPSPRVVFEPPDTDTDIDVPTKGTRRSSVHPPIQPALVSDSDDDSAPTPATPRSTQTPRRKRTAKTPSKKALKAAEQARREAFACELFHELNRTVFRGGLPDNTTLIWNKRLLTTAGRASYKRSRADGIIHASIELAIKILDSDDRIRHTLAHEMCHLASWIIDQKVDENHGAVFKRWGKRVMAKRSDIKISTTHNYDISYPYEWVCSKCTKRFGRFSKSIKVDKSACVCGGTLVPTFETRAPRTPKAQAATRAVTDSDDDNTVEPIVKSLVQMSLHSLSSQDGEINDSHAMDGAAPHIPGSFGESE